MAKVFPTGFGTMSPALAQAHNYHDWLFRLTRPYLGRRILECGVGNGEMTRFLLQTDAAHIHAIDINDACLKKLKDKTADGRLTLTQYDLSTSGFAEAFANQGIDTVIIFNVLEHLPNDQDVLDAIARLLGPRGRIVVLAPAFKALYGGMDAAAGHFRRYSRMEMADKLKGAGFSDFQSCYLNPLGFFGWWLMNRVCKVKTLDDVTVNAQILIFDRYLLRFSIALERFTRQILGQSVFAVGRTLGTGT